MHIIVATSIREQQEVISYLKEKLHELYHADPSVSIVQTTMTQIELHHQVKDSFNVAARYLVVLVPVSMSLDKLQGYSHRDNININKLLKKLDRMKAEAIAFVNAHKKPSIQTLRHQKQLTDAVQSLFT